MCSLFGILDYKGSLTQPQRLRVVQELGKAAQIRGTDATGIAFFHAGTLHIQKAPKPARRMKYRIPDTVRVIMGHTRMTTQGSEKKNQNNHPFPGKTEKGRFALAHNGVLYNDADLRRQYHLPPSMIETDSYVAVQLLERRKVLDHKSLQAMAEDLEGSFTITVLDDKNSLYFVRGNNPLAIWQFPSLGVYLYASTEEILRTAVSKLGISTKDKIDVPTRQGDILEIDSAGERTLSRFNDRKLAEWQNPWRYGWGGGLTEDTETESYLDQLVDFGLRMGVPEPELHLLLDAGYDAFDMEELLYDPTLRRSCVQEILCDWGVC